MVQLVHVNKARDFEKVEYGHSVNEPARVRYLKERCIEVIRAFPGNVVEVGVYRGGTIIPLGQAVKEVSEAIGRKLRVVGIDTFTGHPYSDSTASPFHKAGMYSNVDVDSLRNHIEDVGLADYVELVEGWAETVLDGIDFDEVSFVHVDCDLYKSVRICAQVCESRLPNHGTVFFDDYGHDHCPGATAAVREVFGDGWPFVCMPIGNGAYTAWSCEISMKQARRSTRSLIKYEGAEFVYGGSSGRRRGKEGFVDVNLNVVKGESISIVGRSGSGKTTMLRSMAQIIQADNVFYGDFPEETRGFLFQEETLFPWTTVEGNIRSILRLAGREGNSLSRGLERAKEILKSMNIEFSGVSFKYPQQLSGGERRRVQLASVLAYAPTLVLLDEPTSNVDFETKEAIQALISNYWQSEIGRTLVVVTHDIDEAILLGERVILMESGRIRKDLRIGLPFPRDASFLGSFAYKSARAGITGRNFGDY